MKKNQVIITSLAILQMKQPFWMRTGRMAPGRRKQMKQELPGRPYLRELLTLPPRQKFPGSR